MKVKSVDIATAYIDNYGRLYDGMYNATTEKILLDVGERLLTDRKDLVSCFACSINDFITSDREVEAFALAVYELKLDTADSVELVAEPAPVARKSASDKPYKAIYCDGEDVDTMKVSIDGLTLTASVNHSDFLWGDGVPADWYDNLGARQELEDNIKKQAKDHGIDPNSIEF